jgi:hypothetical protein
MSILSFKEFLQEAATLDEKEYRNKRQAGKRTHITKATAALSALKHAHSAKLRGDEERHSYWLKRAYARLTEKR